MSDPKSKMPDLKELASMTGKLYSDIKASVGQIIQDYKEIREQSGIDTEVSNEEKPVPKPVVIVKTDDSKKE